MVKAWKRVRQARRQALPPFCSERLRERDGDRCYFCRYRSTDRHPWLNVRRGFEVEHLIPVSRGGRSDLANLVLACKPCNRKKATLTSAEFLAQFPNGVSTAADYRRPADRSFRLVA